MSQPFFIVLYNKRILVTLSSLMLTLLTLVLFIHIIDIQKIPLSAPLPLEGKVVAIDAGHGGIDTGTHYAHKLLEKDLNLEIALKLQKALVGNGAKVIMTRETDISLDHQAKTPYRHREDLNARVYIINKNTSDLFVSIHGNYVTNSPSTLGPIVFYYGKSEKSNLLASHIQDSLNTLSAYRKVGAKAKHTARRGDFVLLRETAPPGVLVETGFFSNAVDRTLLQKESHQEEMAQLIIQGIIQYFTDPLHTTN